MASIFLLVHSLHKMMGFIMRFSSWCVYAYMQCALSMCTLVIISSLSATSRSLPKYSFLLLFLLPLYARCSKIGLENLYQVCLMENTFRQIVFVLLTWLYNSETVLLSDKEEQIGNFYVSFIFLCLNDKTQNLIFIIFKRNFYFFCINGLKRRK